MFGSEILDTAIGLVFVFLLVAMLVTITNELLAALLLSRAKWLRFGIARLIGPAWATKLYAHPLIAGTAASAAPGIVTEVLAWRGTGPSYLSSRAFADVLVHLVVEQDTWLPTIAGAVRAAVRDGADPDAMIAALDGCAAIRAGAPRDAAIAADLAGRLRANRAADPRYSADAARADVEAFLDALPSACLGDVVDRIPATEKIGPALRLLLREARGDVDRFKQNIEVWFDNAMDRVSGWYKRRTQWVAASLAVAAAIGLNVDAMAIVGYLQTHVGVRDALVAKAKAYGAIVPPKGAAADDARQFDETARAFEATRAELASLDLPVGWTRETSSGWRAALATHWLGWLVTALAATLGAPFWFDTLNRFVAIRSAGKAPEEQPRPPKELPRPLAPGEEPGDPRQGQTGPRAA